MLLDRPERIGLSVDEALVLLEFRNLKGKDNQYLRIIQRICEKNGGCESMINYTNIDIESEGTSHASGIITAMQIIMNNTPNVREAVVGAKNMYDNINQKLGKMEERVSINTESIPEQNQGEEQ